MANHLTWINGQLNEYLMQSNKACSYMQHDKDKGGTYNKLMVNSGSKP